LAYCGQAVIYWTHTIIIHCPNVSAHFIPTINGKHGSLAARPRDTGPTWITNACLRNRRWKSLVWLTWVLRVGTKSIMIRYQN
jgi:hypothetical protein